MKNIFISLMMLFILNSARAVVFNSNPSDSFGVAWKTTTTMQKPLSGVVITVFDGSIKVLTTISTKYGGFLFYLKHNKLYTFLAEKPGYITEKFEFDTKVPNDLLKQGGIGETFDIELMMFEDLSDIKKDIFEKPVKRFVYNYRTGYVDVDAKNSKITQLSQVKSKIDQARKKNFQLWCTVADGYKKKNNYEDALVAYTKALELNPDDQMTISKQSDARKIVKKGKNLNEHYSKAISDGDELFKSKKYFDARENYYKAKVLKPKEIYPLKMVLLIDSISASQYAENKQSYDLIISRADKEFKAKDYQISLEDYQKALELLPDQQYPKTQITAINKILSKK